MSNQSKRHVLPFSSIVGQEQMKKALILNAINPRIGGVLVRGDKGTAKSTAVRALADILPEIDIVSGCPFNCNPRDEREMCSICRDKYKKGIDMDSAIRRIRVVDLPLGVTEDRVVGTIDLEKAIKEGMKAVEPGILASVNRGILYIDEINLLDDHVADVLLDAAAMGVNTVEREGISLSHPAKFILIGTMNPEEGELRPQLLDRFGLQVSVVGQRTEIIRIIEEYERNPDFFAEGAEKDQNELRDRILSAQEILPEVTVSNDLLEMLSSTCIEMGVRTHRADITIVRTAKTIAALDKRTEVTMEDVREAMEFALPHRMRRKPFEEPKIDQEKLDESIKDAQEKLDEQKKNLMKKT